MTDKPQSLSQKKFVESHLTHREEAAYHAHLKAKEHPLSPTLQAAMFELYLKGNTIDQVHRLNKNIRLGSIVRAAVEGDWYNRRNLYVQGILDGIRLKVQQTLAEGTDFLSDFLAAFHKLYGEKFKLYLQTGDESVLGDLKPTSIQQYRLVLDTMLKSTGIGNTTTVNVKGEVSHQHSSPLGDTPANQGMTSRAAAELLFALQGRDIRELDVAKDKE